VSRRELFAPWQKCLNDYLDSPTTQSASALLEQINKETTRVDDIFPDCEEGLYKLALIAAVAPALNDLPMRYVPLEIIDWGLKVVRAAAVSAPASSRAIGRINEAADRLKERVSSAIGDMGVLCPDEIEQIQRLRELWDVLANTKSPALNQTKEASELLYRTVKSRTDLSTLRQIEDKINARIDRTMKDQREYWAAGKTGKIVEVIGQQQKMLTEVKGKLRDKRKELPALPGQDR
jgi:hypothetical protein